MIKIFLLDQESEKWEVPMSTLNFTEELNLGASGYFSFKYVAFQNYVKKFGNYDADGILTERYREIQIFKHEKLFFSGVIRHMRINESGGSAQDATITLTFSDWSSILSKRRINLEFYNRDSSEIIWEMINHTQMGEFGDIGIKRGSIVAGKKRQRVTNYATIKDVIIGLSNAKLKEGVDWNIDKYKKLNIAPSLGKNLPDIIFNDSNSFNLSSDTSLFGELTNRVFVKGEDDEKILCINELTRADKWGLQEDFISLSGVVGEDTLESHAREKLKSESDPEKTRTISLQHYDSKSGDGNISIDSYAVGDWVRLNKPKVGINEMLRVVKRTLELSNDGFLVTLVFNKKQLEDQYYQKQNDLDKRIENIEKSDQIVKVKTLEEKLHSIEVIKAELNKEIGTIRAFAGNHIPEGWLPCDGRALSRNEYTTLFQLMGTTWGSGDGVSTFNLPDLRGRVLVGSGAEYELAQNGGEKEIVLTEAQMPKHQHETFQEIIWQSEGRFLAAGDDFTKLSLLSGETIFTDKKGDNQPHNNMQPYAVINYIIKCKAISLE